MRELTNQRNPCVSQWSRNEGSAQRPFDLCLHLILGALVVPTTQNKRHQQSATGFFKNRSQAKPLRLACPEGGC